MKRALAWILTWPKRFNWRVAGAALCSIGILHILTTFAAPSLATATAYDRLAIALPPNAMRVLPPITAGDQPLPFLAPDGRYAMCRFDARHGSVSVKAGLPGPGWSLALYNSDGTNFYTAVSPPGRRIEVSLLLTPGEDRFQGLTPEARGERRVADTTLTITADKGLAVIEAPDQGAAYAARNLEELKRAQCSFKPL